MSRVALEVGKRWVFATALDWPGWCRRGKGEVEALEELAVYADRYALVAGPSFRPGRLEVVGSVAGTATTDFGAPGARGQWDEEPMAAGEADRLVGLLERSWAYFDEVLERAPAELRKGPRGGGRSRDEIADHVREAERSYRAKAGRRIPPGTPWGAQRADMAAALRSGATEADWPPRYVIRRAAWHVLDHAWEIEDKSPGR